MKTDIVVVGAGTSGCCAAIAAARHGANVTLIECNGFLGGNAANGLPWLGFNHPQTHRRVVGGIPYEIITRLQKIGGATKIEADPICGSVVGVNSTYLKMILSEMIQESKVNTLLHTFVTKVEEKTDSVIVSYSNAQETGEIECKRLIDSTDSGFAAISAGSAYCFGRSKDNKPQVASMVVRFGNINTDELISYFKSNPTQMRPFKLSGQVMNEYISNIDKTEVFILGAFPELIKKACNAGVEYPRDRLIGGVNVKEKEMILVASRVEEVNPMINSVYTKAEFDGLHQTYAILKLLQEYLPGCENAKIVASGHSIGLRETNHIKGDYQLTADDLLNSKRFSDSIALGGYHLDIHSPDTNGLETHFPPEYEIPYRSLIPANLSKILIAGRCISATQEAQASVRVIPILGAISQAAGTAAALSIQQNCDLRKIDINLLRNTLITDSAVLN